MPPMQSLQRISPNCSLIQNTPRSYYTGHPLHTIQQPATSESHISSWSPPQLSKLAKTEGTLLNHLLTAPPSVKKNTLKMNAFKNISLYSERRTIGLSQSGPKSWIKPSTESSVNYSDFRTSGSPPRSNSTMHYDRVKNTHFEMNKNVNSNHDSSSNLSTNQTGPNNTEFPCSYVTSKLPPVTQFDEVIDESNLYGTRESLNLQTLPKSGHMGRPPPLTRCSNAGDVGREPHDVSSIEGHISRKRSIESCPSMEQNKKYKSSDESDHPSCESSEASSNPKGLSANKDTMVSDNTNPPGDNEAGGCDGSVAVKSKSQSPQKSTHSPNRCPSPRDSKSTLDNKTIKDSNTDNSPRAPFLPPCKICGAKASGFHYGVNSCEACKGFFRRVLKSPVAFYCTKNNSCNLKRNKRSSCRLCRYKRCLSLGMSKEAIKTGRYSHQKRTQDIMAVKYLQSYKDPECDYFELDAILENLLVSHHSNIVSSARFQDSYLYKKQKDYHKMFMIQRKNISTAVTGLKNVENGNIPRENSPTSKTRLLTQKLSKSSTEDTNDSISGLKKSFPHKRSKLESILLNIPCEDTTACNASQSASPTYSPSSNDSGFSDYYGHCDDTSSRPTTQTRTIRPSNVVNESPDPSIVSRLAFSKSSTLPSANSQHSNNIKSHSVDFVDDSDSKVLEEILKEFNQPFSSSTDSKPVARVTDSGLVSHNEHERGQPEHADLKNSKTTESIRENTDSPLNVPDLYNSNTIQQNARRLSNTTRILKSDVFSNSSRIVHSSLQDDASSKHKFKLPGLDTVQQDKDSHHLNRAAKCVTGYINFAKSIPGFESLPQQDQAIMLRLAWDEIWILGAYRGFNCELGVAVMPSGVCFHMEEMEQSWGQDYARLAFDLADILKRSGVSEEMLVLLKAICITSPDRWELKDRENTEKTHWLLVRCLINHLDTAMPKPEMTFPGLIAILTSLRNLSELAQAHLSQGTLDLHAESIGRNIMSEPVTPF